LIATLNSFTPSQKKKDDLDYLNKGIFVYYYNKLYKFEYAKVIQKFLLSLKTKKENRQNHVKETTIILKNKKKQ
jgi:hypothetical protein